MASGKAELRLGFWVGLGIMLALAAWSLAHLIISKVVPGHG